RDVMPAEAAAERETVADDVPVEDVEAASEEHRPEAETVADGDVPAEDVEAAGEEHQPAEPEPTDKAEETLRRVARGSHVVEFVLIVAIALGLAFGIQAFVIKPYKIPSASMEPTLAIGQRVLV